MSEWVGYAVSVSCVAPLGEYQGCVAAADGATLTLTRPFRNGFPYPKDQVTLNAADIRDLRIISSPPAPPAPPSTVERRPRHARTTVLETLQANTTTAPQTTSNGGGGGKKCGEVRSRGRRGRREEGWSPPPQDEFDFELNLRLFDKIDKTSAGAAAGGVPDVVPARYGPDRDVLVAARRPAVVAPAAAVVGRWRGEDGAALPGLTAAGRAALWAGLRRAGALDEACVLLARAAADLALRLVGGARRLHRDNHHQAPTVTASCAPDRIGGVCILALRLLESHGVRTRAEVCGGEAAAPRYLREAAGRWRAAGGGGGALRPDLVLCGGGPPVDAGRAAVLCIERVRPGARACLFALLPPAVPPAPAPPLLLANVAPPPSVFSELDIQYEPPFGASTLLTLYPDDDVQT